MLRTRFIPVFALAAMMSLAFAADDQEFAKDTAMGGMFEVKAGKLATEKGGDQVKTFGAQMIADHGTANDELKALAGKKGWTLPDALGEKHQQKLDHLASLNQPDFDREYIEAMKKDHQDDFNAFKAASESANDADLKAFAVKTLPMVERHLKHIEGMSGAAAGNLSPPNNVANAEPNRTFDAGVNRFQENPPVEQTVNATFAGENAPITRFYTFENGEYVEIPAGSPLLDGFTHECCCRH